MSKADYGLNSITYTDDSGNTQTISVDVANGSIDFGNLDLIAKSVSSSGGVVGMNVPYAMADRSELVTAVNLWISDNTSAVNTYGQINTWNTSAVTDFSYLFMNTSFNSDISSWDVSNSTTFEQCFSGNTAFNGDLSGWDVSSATNFNYMFNGATSFNSDISGWNVGAGGAAHRQNSMFRNASSFNQDLTNWNLAQNGKSHDIRHMFDGATAFVLQYPNGPSSWGNPPSAVALQYDNWLG